MVSLEIVRSYTSTYSDFKWNESLEQGGEKKALFLLYKDHPLWPNGEVSFDGNSLVIEHELGKDEKGTIIKTKRMFPMIPGEPITLQTKNGTGDTLKTTFLLK